MAQQNPTSRACADDITADNASAAAPETLGSPSIPHEFICPITQQIMNVPVMSKQGHTFERSAIMSWITTQSGTCPITRAPLYPSSLASNMALKQRIQRWRVDQAAAGNSIDDGSFHGYSQQASDSQCSSLPVSPSAIPQEYICSLTMRVMTDPIMVRNGISFEREAVTDALSMGDTEYLYLCSVAGQQELLPSSFVPNRKLKYEIDIWRRQKQQPEGCDGRMPRRAPVPSSLVAMAAAGLLQVGSTSRAEPEEPSETLDQLLERCTEILED